MVRLTASGTVVEAEGYVDAVFSLPMKIYQFLMFFVMTLIDPKAAKQARDRAVSSSRTGTVGVRRPMGSVKGTQSDATNCGAGG